MTVISALLLNKYGARKHTAHVTSQCMETNRANKLTPLSCIAMEKPPILEENIVIFSFAAGEPPLLHAPGGAHSFPLDFS